MEHLTDSSEFQEAIRIARELVAQSAVAPGGPGMGHRALTVHAKPAAQMVAGPSPERIAAAADPESALLKGGAPDESSLLSHAPDIASVSRPAVLQQPVAPAGDMPQGDFRGDKLENALYEMCRRGGFIGALIVDDDGLPLAVHNSPVNEAAISAFAMVLGAALSKSGKLLGQSDASNISIDINYTDKIVMRRFLVGESPAYLLIICPQETDERAEVELSIEQITRVLEHR